MIKEDREISVENNNLIPTKGHKDHYAIIPVSLDDKLFPGLMIPVVIITIEESLICF